MIRCSPNLLLVRPKQLETEKAVEGTDIKLVIEYGANAKKLEAATTEGEVIFIGDKTEPWYTLGETLVWGKYAGYWITDPETNEELLLLHPEDVLCVITTGDAK